MEGLMNTETRHEETWFLFKLLRRFNVKVALISQKTKQWMIFHE